MAQQSEARSRRRVIIVPCVGDKVWNTRPDAGPMPAKDAYVESRFKTWRRYAEDAGCPWFILSTEYGLLRPDELIENYSKGITEALRSKALRDRLATQGRELGLNRCESVELLDYEKFVPLLEAAAGDAAITVTRLTTQAPANW